MTSIATLLFEPRFQNGFRDYCISFLGKVHISRNEILFDYGLDAVLFNQGKEIWKGVVELYATCFAKLAPRVNLQRVDDVKSKLTWPRVNAD